MIECTQEIGYLQSINSDKHLPESPLTGNFFKCQLTSLSLIFLRLVKYFCKVVLAYDSSKLLLLFTVNDNIFDIGRVPHKKIQCYRARSFRGVTCKQT
jgi:hypothetical protein